MHTYDSVRPSPSRISFAHVEFWQDRHGAPPGSRRGRLTLAIAGTLSGNLPGPELPKSEILTESLMAFYPCGLPSKAVPSHVCSLMDMQFCCTPIQNLLHVVPGQCDLSVSEWMNQLDLLPGLSTFATSLWSMHSNVIGMDNQASERVVLARAIPETCRTSNLE